MNIQSLQELLENQLKALNKYHDATLKHQKALVSYNLTDLEESIVNEEIILKVISTNETSILECIKEISESYKLSLKENNLKNLLALLYDNKIKVSALTKLEHDIKLIINKIADVNAKNKIIIEHSHNFLNETIQTLVNLNKKNLLDRKG